MSKSFRMVIGSPSKDALIYSIIVIGALLNLVPYFMGQSMKDVTDDGKYPPYVYRIQSVQAQAALAANIAAAIPLYLDHALDYMLSVRRTTFHAYIPHAMMLLVVTIPDLLILTVVIPYAQYDFLVTLMSTRDTMLSCNFLLYLNKLAPKHFSSFSIYWIGACLIFGNLLLTNSFFSTDEVYQNNHDYFYRAFVGSAVIILGISYYKWFSYLYSMRHKPISKLDYVCSIYACVYILFIILQWGVQELPILSDRPEWTSIIGVQYFTLYTCIVFVSITCITVLTTRLAKQEVVDITQTLKARMAFTRYISHEIRTPLNIVKTGLKVLEEDLKDGIPRFKLTETILDIASSCAIAVDTLNEMLTYDKVESNNMVLEREDINVERFMIDSLRPFFLQARAKNINFKMNIAPGTEISSLYFHADESKLAQVIRNLISNALKFTPEYGDVTVRVSDEKEKNIISLGCTPRVLKIEVIDCGAGISEENQGKLFKGIVQFHAGKLQSGGGTGLGLYISKGIMDLHGGDLTVFSFGEGRGAVFTMIIPLLLEDETEHYTKSPEAKRRVSKRNSIDLHLLKLFRSESSLGTSGKKVHPLDNDNNNTIEIKDINDIDPPSSFRNSIFSGHKNLNFGKTATVQKVDKSSSNSSGILRQQSEMIPQNKSTMMDAPLVISKQQSEYIRKHSHTKGGGSKTMNLSTCKTESFSTKNVMSAGVLTQRLSIRRDRIRNLLIVDDSDINRKMMTRIMNDRSDECDDVNNGLNAVIKVREGMINNIHYDVILMDYHMPGMDGPDAARAIRELGYTGLIIGLTGDGSEEDTRHFLSLGANHVLLKPLDTDVFDNIIKSHMAKIYNR